MANTLVSDAPGTSPQEVKKLRRKQAKREAALMLDIELAKKQVEKAGRKLAKAQLKLDDSQKSLQREEDKLSTLRTTGQQKLDKVLALYVSGPIQLSSQSEEQIASAQNGSSEAHELNGAEPNVSPDVEPQLPVDQTDIHE